MSASQKVVCSGPVNNSSDPLGFHQPSATEKAGPKRWVPFSVAVLTLGACCLCYGLYRHLTWYIQTGMTGDFIVYYNAASALLQDLPVYDREIVSPNGFLYPPVSLALFVIFTPFSLEAAYAMFMFVIYGAAGLGAWLFIRHLERLQNHALPNLMRISCIVLCLGLAPTYQNVVSGQVNTFVLLLCILFLYLIDRNPISAGLLLGVAAWIKVYPAYLGLLVLSDRQFRKALIGLGYVFFGAPILLMWFIPLNLYWNYFLYVLPKISGIGTVNIFNQSVVAALHRLIRPLPESFEWELYTLSLLGRTVSSALFLIAGATILVWLRRDVKGRSVTAFAALLAIIPMSISMGWGYTYVLIIPLLLIMILQASQRGVWRKLTILFIASGYCIPSYSKIQAVNVLPELLAQLFYCRYALGSLIMVIMALFVCDVKAGTNKPIATKAY